MAKTFEEQTVWGVTLRDGIHSDLWHQFCPCYTLIRLSCVQCTCTMCSHAGVLHVYMSEVVLRNLINKFTQTVCILLLCYMWA